MTEVALRVVAEAQDRASGVLKGFRGEVDRNTESLRKMQKEARTNAEVEGLFIRGREQKLSALADERRKVVTAARAAASEEVDGFGKVKGAVEGASRAKEFLNKTMGLAGFIGIAAGVVTSIAALINEYTGYNSAIKDASAQQDAFNRSLAETAKGNRAFTLSRISSDWQSVAKAQDEVLAKTEEYLKNQAMRAEAEGGVAQAEAKILQYKERIRDVEEDTLGPTLETLGLRREVDELEQKRNYWANQIAISLREEPGLLDQIKAAQERSNVPLIGAQMAAANLSKSLASAEKFAGGVGDALAKAFDKAAWNPFAGPTSDEERKRLEAEKKKADSEREAAGKRGSSMAAARRDREQDLADQLAKARIGFEAGSDYERKLGGLALDRAVIERDYRAKKLSDTERQLKLQMLDLELMTAIAEENERAASAEKQTREEQDQTAQKRIAERRKQSEEKAKESKEARTKDLDARARAIENLGETAARADAPLAALSDRLAGLGSTIQQTAGIWASYTRGQTALGDAIAGTIGTIGSQVAQAISDRRAQALVEGGFETAASIASFASGNIPAGIGHASAAASFFALAAQGGGRGAAAGGSGGARGASGPASNVIQGNFGQSSRSSRPEDTRTVIVHHYGQGIIYGQGSDVARAGRNADRSLAGTGMQNTGY